MFPLVPFFYFALHPALCSRIQLACSYDLEPGDWLLPTSAIMQPVCPIDSGS